MKRLLKGINPWLPVMAFTTAFHINRGSVVDAIIFGTGSLLIVADWKKWNQFGMPERPKISVWLIGLLIFISSSVLFFSKRGGWQDVALFLVLAPLAFSLIYYRDHGPKPSLTPVMNRTKWIWMSLALFMAVSELFAYIFATVYKDDKTYPTISVLVNPVLDLPYGRAIFLALWMMIGVGMLQITRWRRK
ncbi:MAG: hypothetical protein ACKOWH_01280 [Rhodoluna sp.]